MKSSMHVHQQWGCVNLIYNGEPKVLQRLLRLAFEQGVKITVANNYDVRSLMPDHSRFNGLGECIWLGWVDEREEAKT